MSKKYSILYVDDEISNLHIFKNTFRRNYNIYTAETAQEGLRILDQEKIDLILTDQRMPEISGVEFLKSVMVKYPQPYRILITAYTDFEALKDAVNEAKIFQYIQKPWEEKEIQHVIDSALDMYRLKQKNIELTEKLKESNEELIRINQELIELDRLKFQFLNIISHELRTPLNGLIGATTLFKMKFRDEDFTKYEELFYILETSSKRLEHFLLLTERITAFKAKRYQLQPDVFHIGDLIHESVKALQDKSLKKNISFLYDLKDEGNCYADKELIEVCIKELIDNAIKYSHQGGTILIRSFCREKKRIFEVIDQGQGFPDIVLKHKYKAFITSDEFGELGTGLDLALINLIVEAHEGNIDICNNPGGGATVRIVF
ncbi:MAG: hybrid sensor histidine kinase/response regulator [Bacteroidales bacterium]|nr:hybrid sensor histidine kinase/response regulator [Bacteroidales bacterium]